MAGGKPTGKSNTTLRMTIMQRARQIRESEDLLTLDNEIAVTKAIFERQISEYETDYAAYLDIMAKMEAGEYDDDNPPPAYESPSLDIGLLDTMNRLIRTAYDMRFAKRFSIPITELENVMFQIRTAFFNICDRFGVPNEAKIAFAEALAGLSLSRKTDYQLSKAGGELGAPVIDGQAYEVVGSGGGR